MGSRRLRLLAAGFFVAALFAASLHAATTSPHPTPAPAGGGGMPPARRGRSPVKTTVGLSAHPETTDPEVAKAIAAFGAADYPRARTIAEDILKKPDRGSRRSEALDVIVESWLLQGDFDKARAAARKYRQQAPKASREALARVEAEEKEYRADLKRLAARERKAKKTEDKAHFALLIGHAHHKVGRMAEAEKAYRQVIAKYPKTRAAGMAKRQLANMQKEAKRPKG